MTLDSHGNPVRWTTPVRAEPVEAHAFFDSGLAGDAQDERLAGQSFRANPALTCSNITEARQAGFTLLEALITIVVVSIGLLGILGLQTVSIANTQISAARSVAAVAAENIADSIRANPEGDADGFYENIAGPAQDTQPVDCSQACSAQQIATLDAWEWNTALAQRLPNGTGFVQCAQTISGNCRVYQITIAWLERDLSTDADTGTAGNTAPQCAPDTALTRCFVTLVRP